MKNVKKRVSKIREYRQSKGMTQDEFAAFLGIKTRCTIRRWEQGYQAPWRAGLAKLLKAAKRDNFPLTLEDLLEEYDM